MKNQPSTLVRILALSLALVLLLAGCGGQSGGSSASGEATASSETAQSSAASSEVSEASAAEPTELGAVSLPLVDEKTTITVWTPMDRELANVLDNLNETEYFQRLEEETNIHIDFQHPATGNEAEAYNLMIASGTLTDMVKNETGSYYYPDGLDAAVDDGYFLNLTDLLPEYAPHYLASIEDYAQYDDAIRLAAKTDAGRYVGIYQHMKVPQSAWSGLYIRKDWLDDCGLEVPVTYDDWEVALTAFKEQEGATAPLTLMKNDYDSVNDSLCAGFGVSRTFYQEDGVVKYGPAEEGWRSYVTLLHDWYAKGLIDPDFMSSTGWPDESMMTTGKTGACVSVYTFIANYENANVDPSALYVPVAAPKVSPEDEIHLNYYLLLAGYLTVSADSENVETCLKLMDYLFSEEGALEANYGWEGDTFEFDENGVPQFTEKVTANEDFTFSQAMDYFSMPSARVTRQDWTRELAAVPAKDVECYDVWAQSGNENTLLNVAQMGITTEENKEYANIMADVTSIVNEKTVQFITGAVSLDKYDEYLALLDQEEVDRAVEIVQTVYDRFMAR